MSLSGVAIKINTMQRYSGLLGIVILWTSILIAMSRTGLMLVDDRPISYLGIDPLSSGLFSFGLLASALLFLSFGLYVKRVFAVKNNKFLIYIIIGQVSQSIVAIAPYGMKAQYKLLHTIAAFTLAFTLPLLISAFTYSQIGTKYFRIYKGLLLFELLMFVVGMGLFIFTRGIAPLGEALPAIGYHLWIVTVTIIAANSAKAPS